LEKKLSAIGKEFVKDFVGYDRGFLITLVTLVKNPGTVVEDYKNHQGHFTSPFSLIAFATSAFYLSAEFCIDWEQIRQFLVSSTEKPGLKTLFSFTAGMLSRFVWVVPILMQFMVSAIVARMTRNLGLSFYDHLVCGLYYVSIYLLVLTLCLPTYQAVTNLLPDDFFLIEMREFSLFTLCVLVYMVILQAGF